MLERTGSMGISYMKGNRSRNHCKYEYFLRRWIDECPVKINRYSSSESLPKGIKILFPNSLAMSWIKKRWLVAIRFISFTNSSISFVTPYVCITDWNNRGIQWLVRSPLKNSDSVRNPKIIYTQWLLDGWDNSIKRPEKFFHQETSGWLFAV